VTPSIEACGPTGRPALDPLVGADLLADLGFLHVPGLPLADPPAYLFVALRPRPTQRHYDPERIDYWSTVGGRGTRLSLDRSADVRAETDFAWGKIDVVDRKGIANYFVSFGGLLRTRRLGDVRLAVFSSVAPIAACGGHSQEWDPLAGEMAAFVARLRAAAGANAGFEQHLAALTPSALYAGFVCDELARHVSGRGEVVGEGRPMELLRRERQRLVDHHATEWAAGQRLAARLDRRPLAQLAGPPSLRPSAS
jgi:hypothetical protein